jgi:hypothetical protein
LIFHHFASELLADGLLRSRADAKKTDLFLTWAKPGACFRRFHVKRA